MAGLVSSREVLEKRRLLLEKKRRRKEGKRILYQCSEPSGGPTGDGEDNAKRTGRDRSPWSGIGQITRETAGRYTLGRSQHSEEHVISAT